MTEVSAGTLTDHEALVSFARDVQAAKWTDLETAIGHAINGAWSIECANVCVDIARAARLVGPTDWRECPTALVFGGVWDALLTVADIEHAPMTPDDETHVASLYARNSASPFEPSKWRLRYAATIQRMKTPRERSYILTGGE